MIDDTRTILKIPVGCIKRSRSKGILNDVLLYYTLKSVSIDGFFNSNQLIDCICDTNNVSKSQAYKKIKRLINIGLIIKHNNGYNISKYNKLFAILGFNMHPIKDKNNSKRVIRLGNFKIIKLSLDGIKDLRTAIEAEELKHAISIRKDRALMPRISMNSNIKASEFSCKDVARVFGLKSKSSGFKIEKKLEKDESITVGRSDSLLGCNPLRFEKMIQALKDKDRNRYYFVESGLLFQRNPNSITINI